MSANDLFLLAVGTGDFEQNALINSRLVRLRRYLETHAAFATVLVNPKDHKTILDSISEHRKMPKMTQPKTPEKLGNKQQRNSSANACRNYSRKKSTTYPLTTTEAKRINQMLFIVRESAPDQYDIPSELLLARLPDHKAEADKTKVQA